MYHIKSTDSEGATEYYIRTPNGYRWTPFLDQRTILRRVEALEVIRVINAQQRFLDAEERRVVELTKDTL